MLARLLAYLSVSITTLQPAHVAAHSWYPERCCHDMDCQPADKIERLPGGALVLWRGDIQVLVPQGFSIETSPDGRPHFCVYEIDGVLEARCVFLPADS